MRGWDLGVVFLGGEFESQESICDQVRREAIWKKG